MTDFTRAYVLIITNNKQNIIVQAQGVKFSIPREDRKGNENERETIMRILRKIGMKNHRIDENNIIDPHNSKIYEIYYVIYAEENDEENTLIVDNVIYKKKGYTWSWKIKNKNKNVDHLFACYFGNGLKFALGYI